MGYKIYHRRYPRHKWDYKAVSTKIKENQRTKNQRTKEVIYFTLVNSGKRSSGVEVYSGSNYIVGSSGRGHSRKYTMSTVPAKYKKIVDTLKTKHGTIKWSKEEHVDRN